MYKNSEGVRQDYAKALEWYTKAANQGVAEAQFNLGLMYENGEGVRQYTVTAKVINIITYINRNRLSGYSTSTSKSRSEIRIIILCSGWFSWF